MHRTTSPSPRLSIRTCLLLSYALVAVGALQGLYTVDGTGQPWSVDPSSGLRSAIGAGIPSSRWVVPSDCTPTVIDPTVKRLFLLARNASTPTSAWVLLSIDLAEGAVQLAEPLPPTFSPSAAACEHVLTEDGSCHVFVAAATEHGKRLRAQRFTTYGPDPHEWVDVADVAVAQLGLGAALPRPVGAVTDFSLWVTLGHGLVGIDVAGGRVRALPGIAGARWAGLHYDAVQGRVYALVTQAGGGSVVASFDDDGARPPEVNFSSHTIAAAPAAPSAAALRPDTGVITLLDAKSGDLVTASLAGVELARVPGCEGGGSGCPILIGYEPMVFRDAPLRSDAPARPPSILIIMLDQQRYDLAGTGLTPHLDRIAAEGLRFTSFYSSTPTCTPARSALLTGRSPWGHGMLGYGTVAPAWPLEMPSHLNAAGFESCVVGKNHFIDANGQTDRTVPSHNYTFSFLYDGLGDGRTAASGELDTYDRYFAAQTGGADPLKSCGLDWNSWSGCPSGYAYDEALHPTSWVASTALSYLRNRSAAAPPFFLKVSFHRPHSPYDPPLRVYNATPPPNTPIVVGGNWDGNFTTSSAFCGPSNADAWCGSMPADAAEVARRSYRASLAFVDEQVGALMAAVDLGDTWVLHISDHGDGQGEHGLWRKGYPWEMSAHVPGSIRWPDGYAAALPRGATSNALVELRDVFPTAAAIAGAWPLPRGAPKVEGVPLTCLVGGPAAPPDCPTAWRDMLDLEHDIVYNQTIHWSALVGDGRTPAFAGRRLKFVFLAFWPREQLFDLSNDPHEMLDRAEDAQYAQELAAWRAAMVAQFEAEGRGEAWVKGGQLQRRENGQLCSPNFPDQRFC